MRQHPITPMLEADLRQHLALQTDLSVGLHDILRLKEPFTRQTMDRYALEAHDLLLFDVLYPEHLACIGEALLVLAQDHASKFMVGSSGIEYALTAAWNRNPSVGAALEALREHGSALPSFPATEQLVAITGSCSPVNARQIEWAEQHGFETIALDPARLIQPRTMHSEVEKSIEQAVQRLRRGANVILHTSRGPLDPRVAATIDGFRSLGLNELEVRLHSGRRLGPLLGQILGGILNQHPLRRVGIAGGDTSGYIARELKLTALEALAPVAPGSPLCRAHAENSLDGVEFFFKGGQVGKDDVWETMLQGSESPSRAIGV